jgi:hypothetical protein
MESLEGSLDALLQGYIICKGCGRRIEAAGDGTQQVSQAVRELNEVLSKIITGRAIRISL